MTFYPSCLLAFSSIFIGTIFCFATALVILPVLLALKYKFKTSLLIIWANRIVYLILVISGCLIAYLAYVADAQPTVYESTIKSNLRFGDDRIEGSPDLVDLDSKGDPLENKSQGLKAELVDYGIYEISTHDRQDDDVVAGGLVETSDKRLIEETTKIKAQIGTSFGFRYKLFGPDGNFRLRHERPYRDSSGNMVSRYRAPKREANVTIKVIHPKPLKDPNTSKEFTVSKWSQEVPISGETQSFINWNTGWIFENDWEIVEGEWVMQLFDEDRLLIEKKFMVER